MASRALAVSILTLSLAPSLAAAGCVDVLAQAATNATGGPPTKASDGRVLTEAERRPPQPEAHNTDKVCVSGVVLSASKMGGPVSHAKLVVEAGETVDTVFADYEGRYHACVDRFSTSGLDPSAGARNVDDRRAHLTLHAAREGFVERDVDVDWGGSDGDKRLDLVMRPAPSP